MKYYEALLKLNLFSKQQIEELTPSPEAAKSMLHSYVQKGYISRIRRDYYGVNSFETKRLIADRYMIGSNVHGTSYISYHSAFEYHGMANQIFSQIYVSDSEKINGFEYDGVSYQWVPSKVNLGISTFNKVRVTNIERTILDCIKDFDRAGGLEELLRCLSMVTYADESKLLQYLLAYDNQFLYQKVGYILQYFVKGMKLSWHFFDEIKMKIKESKRYLYDGIQLEKPIYSSEWQMYVPKELMKLIDEGGDAIV